MVSKGTIILASSTSLLLLFQVSGGNGGCTVDTILRRTRNNCTTLWSYECNGSPLSQLMPPNHNISLGICDLLIDPSIKLKLETEFNVDSYYSCSEALSPAFQCCNHTLKRSGSLGMSLTTLGMTLLVSLLLYLIDCRDVQCERRWDLLQATCQSSMQPENEHDRQLTSDSNIMTNSGSTSRSDYLIQAVRIQSVLGALVGILSLVLIAVGVGWGWTCRRLVEKRKELRTKSTQTKNPLYGLIYNPVYNNRRIETTASGGQLQDSHDHAYEIISSACYCEGTPTQ